MTSSLSIAKSLLREVVAVKSLPRALRARICEFLDRGRGRPGVDREQVKAMRAAGKSVADIAAALEVSTAAVYRAVRQP